MELYKTLSREVVINGKQHSVTVTISTEMDDLDNALDQDFESADDRGDFIRKLNDGTYYPAIVFVKASFAGETGTDTLGGCVLSSDCTIEHVIAEHGMIENALIDLNNSLEYQYKVLKNLYGVKMSGKYNRAREVANRLSHLEGELRDIGMESCADDICKLVNKMAAKIMHEQFAIALANRKKKVILRIIKTGVYKNVA